MYIPRMKELEDSCTNHIVHLEPGLMCFQLQLDESNSFYPMLISRLSMHAFQSY